MADIKDFTEDKEPKRFRIDDDVFESAASLPVGVVRKFLKLRRTPVDGDDAEQVEDQMLDVTRILDAVLFPASAERFAARLDSVTEPISTKQLKNVMEWLMEEYGERPTPPSSTSSGQPPPTNNISMDGVPHEVSIPETSISAAI